VRDDERRKRWERVTAWPGIVGSVLFLVAYTWTVLSDDQPRALYLVLLFVLGLVWAFFLVDYVVRLALAADRWRFVRRNVVDLLSVLLPLARPFRLLGDLSRIPVLRGNTPAHLRRRVLTIAGIFIVMFIYVIALAEYQVEHNAKGANILTFGDSLWWACVTMATVGYGDYYPVTVTGRLLAIVLMIGGIAIVGTASATVVSYLNERTQHLRHHSPADTGRELRLPQDDDAATDRPETDEGRG
jgi:voltage-gated potassium channel